MHGMKWMCFALLFVAQDPGRGTGSDLPGSAKAAQARYDKEVLSAQRAYEERIAKAREALLSGLKQALQAEVKRGDVDAIVAIQNRIRELESDASGDKRGRVVDLTQLKPTMASVGHASLGVNNSDGAPRSPTLQGKKVESFFMACAPSRITFNASEFSGRKFLAEGIVNHDGTDGVRFIVRVDGCDLFRSDLVTLGVVTNIEAAIPADSKVLELIVDPNENQVSDWSYWLNPRIK